MRKMFIIVGFVLLIGIVLIPIASRSMPFSRIFQRMSMRVPGIPPCPNCNIILINLDTLRADEMECYGYLKSVTPNLCGFAKRNILFSRYYDQTSFTLDSHMSIFTGLYPTSHHVLDALKDSLSLSIPTLPETLKKHGYKTTWVGITNDVNLPLDKGFGRGYDEIVSLTGEDPNWEKRYQEELFPRLAGNEPSYIFFHTYGPHSPYLPGEGPYRFITKRLPNITVTLEQYYANYPAFYRYVIRQYEDRLKKSKTPESVRHNQTVITKLTNALSANDMNAAMQVMGDMPIYESYDQYIGWYWANINGNDPVQRNAVQEVYDERLYQLDQQILPLLTFLNRPDIKRKTIVIFFSDNGEDIMEHGRFDHGWNIYNTSTHAPFILAIPKVKNGVYHELVQAVDMFPTLMDLVGISVSNPMEGNSLLPILDGRGEQQVGIRYLIGEHHGDLIQTIRDDRWKLYKNRGERSYVELYDLMSDPWEQKNIVGKHMDIAGRLDQALKHVLESSPQYATSAGEFPAWVDDEKKRSLIEEGYF